MTALLIVDKVELSFGGIRALDEVSFEVSGCEIAAIIGPNGAGKTSLLNAISGLYAPRAGSITFEGTPMCGRRPHEIACLGVARTFQNLGLFPNMSVVENLLLGRHLHMRAGILQCGLAWRSARREEARQRDAIAPVVQMLQLERVQAATVGTLPYGLQKRVELARALVQLPRLLLLDEPLAGMNQHEKQEMADCIVEVQRKSALTVLMIEHDVGVVMDIADHVIAMDFGRTIADGTPQEVQQSPAVLRAYLGAGTVVP